MKSFQVTEATRRQDLLEIFRFLEQVCEEHHTVLYTAEENVKVVTRNIWNYFDVFWNVRPSTTGIPPVFMGGIITARIFMKVRQKTKVSHSTGEITSVFPFILGERVAISSNLIICDTLFFS